MGPARDLGPCTITWGSTDLGSFWEEVRFKFEETFADVFESLFGTTPVDSVITGAGACEVTVPFTRMTLANLTLAMPGGSNSGAATGNVTVSAKMVGANMYTSSLPLFLKPVSSGAAAANGTWLRVEHAYPVPSTEIVYNNKDQRVYNVTFRGFPDATTKKTWSIGKVNSTAT